MRLAKHLLHAFTYYLLIVARRTQRRPWLIIAVCTLITFITLSQLKHIRFVFSAEDMVGEGLPSADELKLLKERFADGTSSILVVNPPQGVFSFSPDQLCEFRKWYSYARVVDPEIKTAASSFDLAWPVFIKKDQLSYQNVIRLDCDKFVTAKAPREIKTDLDSSPFPAVKSNSEKLSLVFVFTYRNSEDEKFGSFNPKLSIPLRDSFTQLIARVAPEAQFHWVGPADYQWYVMKGFELSIIVNAGMVLALMLLLRFGFGTWRSGLIFCGTLLVNGVWIYGGKAFIGSPYDVLSSGLFLILGVSALEDFVFMSSAQLRGVKWQTSVRQLLISSFFTSLTTMIGFGSLISSDLEIVRRFGIWSAMGAFFEWLMLFYFVPALLKTFYKKTTWVDPQRAYGKAFFDSIRTWHSPVWVTRTCMIAFPLSIYGFFHLNSNDVPSRIFPQSHPYNIGLNEMKSTRGWTGSVSLIMEEKDSDQDLERIANALILDPELQSTVVTYDSAQKIVDWIIGGREIDRRITELEFAMTETYKQLVDPDNIPRANLYLTDISVLGLQKLKAIAAKHCGSLCHLGGDLVAYSDFSAQVPKTLLDSISMSLLLVATVIVFLALALGKAELIFPLLASSFWGPCLMIFILYFFAIPMDFLKCIFASVLVGLTGDNAIQYLFAAKRRSIETGIALQGAASIQTNLFMAITSLLYLASYFDPPKAFGLILSSGLMASLFGDLWILNGLLNKRHQGVK